MSTTSYTSSQDKCNVQRRTSAQCRTWQAYEDACTAPTKARIASVRDTCKGLYAALRQCPQGRSTFQQRQALRAEIAGYRVELAALTQALAALKSGAIDSTDVVPF